ncbi:MAG: dicarboxylate/amino acid:cation symporter [Bacteroidia bacterium]|nr:dicarboxylate/amino acid:cation symporter [Bacteroidia bacterium]
MKLYTKILIGMALGILAGYIYNVAGWQDFTIYTDWIGTIFINLVKMVVIPLVVVSLILGAASLGDIKTVGKMGAKAFGFFMFTTAVAVCIGLIVGNVMRPGDGLPEDKKEVLMAKYQDEAAEKTQTDGAKEFQNKSSAEKLFDLLVSFVPTNPLKAMTDGQMLGVIFFSLFLGICMTLIDPAKAAPLIKAFDGLNDAVIKMVTLAMETAPYGVFALMLGVVANLGLDIMGPLILYGLAVLIALILHIAITHGSFIFFYLKKSPVLFIRAIKEAIVFGFSTSSSSATLPISMNLAENNLGASKQVSSFVLPLGATINMDGTAAYQAVAALFIAQVFGFDLDMTAQLTIILTATLASVGAAGVPGAGMITLALVLSTLGIPEAGIALIFGLDRLLDMCRTVVNIIGDLTLTGVMAKSEGEELNIRLDRDVIPG